MIVALSLADQFAIGVAVIIVAIGFLFVVSLGGPVIVSWTWRWCQKAFESCSLDGAGRSSTAGLGLGEVPRGRNTTRGAGASSVNAPKDAAGSEPANSHSFERDRLNAVVRMGERR